MLPGIPKTMKLGTLSIGQRSRGLAVPNSGGSSTDHSTRQESRGELATDGGRLEWDPANFSNSVVASAPLSQPVAPRFGSVGVPFSFPSSSAARNPDAIAQSGVDYVDLHLDRMGSLRG